MLSLISLYSIPNIKVSPLLIVAAAAGKRRSKGRIQFDIGLLPDKGQLISECRLGVIDFPKKQRKFWQISAIESKKWSNQQSEGTFL